MRDEIDARIWVEHGPEFSRGVSRLLEELWQAWQVLNCRQYTGPWRRRATCSPAGRL